MVWHKGLLYKLKQCGVSGDLFEWFNDYLKNRQNRVIIEGATSSWCSINAGVLQGSVLGPLLFLIFINDVVQVIVNSEVCLFADDTLMYVCCDNRDDGASRLNRDLELLNIWAKKWHIKFSASKSKTMLFTSKSKEYDGLKITLDGNTVDWIPSHKHLGIILNSNLKWTDHIDTVFATCMKRLDLMRALKYKLDKRSLEIIYTAFIRPMRCSLS